MEISTGFARLFSDFCSCFGLFKKKEPKSPLSIASPQLHQTVQVVPEVVVHQIGSYPNSAQNQKAQIEKARQYLYTKSESSPPRITPENQSIFRREPVNDETKVTFPEVPHLHTPKTHPPQYPEPLKTHNFQHGSQNTVRLQEISQTNTMVNHKEDMTSTIDVKIMKKTEEYKFIPNYFSISQNVAIGTMNSLPQDEAPQASTQQTLQAISSLEVPETYPTQIPTHTIAFTENLSCSHPATLPQVQEENFIKTNLPLKTETKENVPLPPSKPDDLQPRESKSHIEQPSPASSAQASHQEAHRNPSITEQSTPSKRPPQVEGQTPAAENSMRSSVCYSDRSFRKSVRLHRLNERGFDNPTARECFANALLQVLYNMSEFKDRVLDLSSPSNETQRKLCLLFQAIEDESSSQREVQKNKRELIDHLERKNQGIVILGPKGGDSRTLFQVLASSISEEQSFEENHIFSLFSSGNLEKVFECPKCKDEGKNTAKMFSEKLLMLSAQEDLYYHSEEEPSNFFQAESEVRRCMVCHERIPHQKKITLAALPKVLAIKIEDSSANSAAFHAGKPHRKLRFSDSRGVRVDYKLFGGVYNTQRGFDGVHSVAYVRENEDGNAVKLYNDSMVRTIPWENMDGYAKLLFYCKE